MTKFSISRLFSFAHFAYKFAIILLSRSAVASILCERTCSVAQFCFAEKRTNDSFTQAQPLKLGNRP